MTMQSDLHAAVEGELDAAISITCCMIHWEDGQGAETQCCSKKTPTSAIRRSQAAG